MRRLAIGSLLVLVLACSGKNKGTTPTAGGSGSGSDTTAAVYAKRLAVSWAFQPAGEFADVFLVVTDETGKQVSHPIGRYKGVCEQISPAKEMNAINGAACRAGGGGTELHAVARPDEIIVVQMGITANPDPMAREELIHVKVPLGIAIEAAK
jgi:hypothetical protein